MTQKPFAIKIQCDDQPFQAAMRSIEELRQSSPELVERFLDGIDSSSQLVASTLMEVRQPRQVIFGLRFSRPIFSLISLLQSGQEKGNNSSSRLNFMRFCVYLFGHKPLCVKQNLKWLYAKESVEEGTLFKS